MEDNQKTSQRDFIFGANDGLAISLVLLVGIKAWVNIESEFFIASIFIISWGAIVTSLSIYFTGSSEIIDKKRNLSLIKDDEFLRSEIEYTKKFLIDLDLDYHIQNLAIKDLEEERKSLLLDPNIINDLSFDSPIKMAITYFLGFILAALIPLFTYLQYFNSNESTKLSLIIAVPFLFILSYIKGGFVGVNKLFSAFSYTIITIVAAVIIYSITNIFS